MVIKNRQIKIVEIIRKEGQASVEELATLLDISRETIRRDLSELSTLGKIRKIHGGATLPNLFGEGSFQERMSRNAEAKTKIARAATSLFNPGETIFTDTGSTTLYFSEGLAEISGLTVVTNSTEIARTVSASSAGSQAFLLGGEFNPGNLQTVGTMVTTQIRSFRAHHAVLTVGALDAVTGAMDYNIEEALVARAMIEQSQSVTIISDSSKFDELASFEVCSLYEIDRLVCDRAPPNALQKALDDAEVELIIAE